MSTSILSTRLSMSSRTALRSSAGALRPTASTYTRSFASGSGAEPPRTQQKPAQAGEAKAWMPIAAAGLGLGAVFFYLMSQPHNAPKVAHATGQNLKELSSRDTVDAKTGTRMGTHKAD